VGAWLIGPSLDAWLKAHPDDRAGTHHQWEGFVRHLGEAGIGSVREVFAAEKRSTPPG